MSETTVEQARAWLAEYARRQGANELLCKPPIGLQKLNSPTFTQDEVAEIMQAVREWLRQTAVHGGPNDLLRVFATWQPYNPKMRSALRGGDDPENFDALLQLGRVREIEMLSIVEAADAAENAKRSQLERINRERAAIGAEQKKLAERRKALRELEGRV
jgi:hypothetical protein